MTGLSAHVDDQPDPYGAVADIDRIIGYITRNQGVTIHRQDCYNVIREVERERLVTVEWGDRDAIYPVSVRVESWDRVGMIRDVTTLVADEKINISSVSLANHEDQTISVFLTLEIRGLAQLSGLLKKIEGIKGIISVARIGVEPSKRPAPKLNKPAS